MSTPAPAEANWYVEIVRDADGSVEKRMGPFAQKWAEKVHDGVMINLDHMRYSARVIVKEKKA